MKKLYILFIFAAFQFSSCQSMTIGILTIKVTTGNITQFIPASVVSEQAAYVANVGGLTFTYPSGTFTLPPTVRVEIENNSATTGDSTVYVSEISANSATSTTVMAYALSTSTLTEAPTGANLIIHFVAAGT